MDAPWVQLSAALDELDGIRHQLGEARATERTARFYHLARTALLHTERGGHVGDVIELSGGWVLLHWRHDPRSISLYSSIDSARAALSMDGAFVFVLGDVASRVSSAANHSTVSEPLLMEERQTLGQLRLGLSNGEIGQKLSLSTSTVKNRLSRIYRKIGVKDRLQAGLMCRDWLLDDPTEEEDK